MPPISRRPSLFGVSVSRLELVFLDANVIFSASIGSMVCRAILGLSGIKALTSDYCLSEVERNLVVKGYDASKVLAEHVEKIEVVVTPHEMYWRALSALLPAGAASDLAVLGAAKAAKADVLVTGKTRDFSALMDRGLTGGPLVLTPRAFLERGPQNYPSSLRMG